MYIAIGQRKHLESIMPHLEVHIKYTTLTLVVKDNHENVLNMNEAKVHNKSQCENTHELEHLYISGI